jgi:hypothetical protein
MTEKRLESRYLCADLVRVSWMSGRDRFSTVDAVLEDISARGACVQVEGPIPEGRLIALVAGDAHLVGFVSYCVAREFGYYVGFEFSVESKWRSEEFRPQHLTSVRNILHVDN